MITILNSKKNKIIIGVLVLLFMGLYEWILNTSDEFGYRCQTFYNLSKYKLIAGGEIDIIKNSCFVEEVVIIQLSLEQKWLMRN